MQKSKSDFQVHVFVCTQQKNSGQCCAQVGGEPVRGELKDWSKQNPAWKGRIRVNSSGCLDRCKDGVAVAIYPQNEWFINVKPDDLDELKERIQQLMDKKA